MRDVDELRRALRETADGLPPLPLLSGVRSRAQTLRRRLVAGAAAAVVLVLVIVLGIGYLALRAPQQTAGSVKPDTTVAELIGPTWYLASWTTSNGTVVRPATDRPPTLVFDSQTAAHSDDTANTTAWTVRLSKGIVLGVEGPTTAVSESEQSQAAGEALSAVLAGAATWQIRGSELVIRRASGRTVTYARTVAEVPTSAVALADNFYAVIGRTWALASITQSGRTWVPDTPTPTTLQIWSGGEAQADDGDNNTEWSVEQSGGSLTWKRIWPPTVITTGATRNVDVAVSATLAGRTAWTVHGDVLVIGRPNGDSVTFSSDRRTPVVGHAAVSLDALHGCGVQACGRGLVAGAVTIAKESGIVVWRMPVTAHDDGNDVLAAGVYTVTATIADGLCTPATVIVVVGQSTPVSLTCRDGLSKD
jgi:META domain